MAKSIILVNLASVSIPPTHTQNETKQNKPQPKTKHIYYLFGFKLDKFDLEVIENSKHETLV